jgi:hypothetical protein
MIIFPFCISKSVQGRLRREYDQRMIIKFLLNERADPGDIAETAGTLW